MADIDAFTTLVMGKIEDVITLADGVAAELINIAQGRLSTFEFSAIPDYDDSTKMVDYTPANVTMDTVSPYVAPTTPSLLNLTPPSGTINPIDWTRADAALAAFDPDAFDPTAISGEITDLAAKVMELIDSGGPGISDAAQTALMNNMRARDLQTLDDTLLRVRQENSMSGWPRSTSLHEASENELRKKYQDTYDNRSSEILALMTERAHATAMNALNQGVSLTGIKSDLQKGIWQLFYSMQALILDEFKTLVSAEETRVKTELEKILGDYDIYKTMVLTDKDIKLETFRLKATGEEIRVKAQTELAVAKADVGIKSNDLLLRAAVAEVEAQIKKWSEEVVTLTERGKAEIQQLLENNTRRVYAATTKAEYYKSLTTGLSQTINTIMSKKF